jgi:stage II sporulation protein D
VGVTLLLLACYTQVPRRPAAPAPAAERLSSVRVEPVVRVALVDSATSVEVSLPGAWTAIPDQGERLVVTDPGVVTVKAVGGGLTLQGEAVSAGWPSATSVRLEPQAAGAVFGLGARRYPGAVVVRRVTGGVRLIARVGLEDYLTGVLGSEMPLRWDDAALEAQAVAARTYALASLRPDDDHDLEADERSQVFGGVGGPDHTRARAIIDATRGEVLTWQGKVFTTYFHSTCGGDTIPAAWVFGPADDIPPLQGATGCPCQASKAYRWVQDVDLATDKGAHELVLELPLREVSVEALPRGGYAKTVTFVDAGGERLTRPASVVRRLFRLKSTAFEVRLDETRTHLVFNGRGWGHGVGLCQWGAEGFAKAGTSAAEILAHYYPGATLERMPY